MDDHDVLGLEMSEEDRGPGGEDDLAVQGRGPRHAGEDLQCRRMEAQLRLIQRDQQGEAFLGLEEQRRQADEAERTVGELRGSWCAPRLRAALEPTLGRPGEAGPLAGRTTPLPRVLPDGGWYPGLSAPSSDDRCGRRGREIARAIGRHDAAFRAARDGC